MNILAILIALLIGGPALKEHPYIFEKALVNGLTPDERMRRNGLFMESMVNAEPTEIGAVVPDAITEPFSDTVTHPFPQLFRGERNDYLLGAATISTANVGTGTTTLLQPSAAVGGADTTITARGAWQHASFHDIDFFSNGASLVWCGLPSSDGEYQITNNITVQAITAHNNRLIVGGLDGDWFAGDRWRALFDTWRETQPIDSFAHEDMTFDEGWIVWGERGGGDSAIPFYFFLVALGAYGDDIFDASDIIILQAIERGEIGMCPLRKAGEVRALKPLANDIMAYGANSVSRLTPAGNTYTERDEATVGIGGRLSVNGDDTEHVWVDNEGYVHRTRGEERDVVLGYEHLLGGGEGESVFQAYTSYVYDYTVPDEYTFGAVYEDEIYKLVSDGSGNVDVRVTDMAGVIDRNWTVGPYMDFDFFGVNFYDSKVWVQYDNKVVAYSTTGTLLSTITVAENGPIAFRDDKIYLLGANTIKAYSTAGVLLSSWSVDVSSIYKNIVTVGDNVVYSSGQTIYVYSLTGTLVDSFGSILAPGADVKVIGSANGDIYFQEDYSDIVACDLSGAFITSYHYPAMSYGFGSWVDDTYLLAWVADVPAYAQVTLTVLKSFDDLIVLHDPLLSEYRITDGTRSYSLTPTGMGGPHTLYPTSMFRDSDLGLVGVASGVVTQMKLTTFPIDTGSRGKKHAALVLLDAENLTAAKTRILWRMDNGEVYRNGPLVPFNKQMAAFPRTSFVDGKIYIEANATVDAVVHKIEARIQHEDRRYYRGTRALTNGVSADE